MCHHLAEWKRGRINVEIAAGDVQVGGERTEVFKCVFGGEVAETECL
jgi:hypothetical protein